MSDEMMRYEQLETNDKEKQFPNAMKNEQAFADGTIQLYTLLPPASAFHGIAVLACPSRCLTSKPQHDDTYSGKALLGSCYSLVRSVSIYRSDLLY